MYIWVYGDICSEEFIACVLYNLLHFILKIFSLFLRLFFSLLTHTHGYFGIWGMMIDSLRDGNSGLPYPMMVLWHRHLRNKGSIQNVGFNWENGEVTCKPMGIVAKSDQVACAIFCSWGHPTWWWCIYVTILFYVVIFPGCVAQIHGVTHSGST